MKLTLPSEIVSRNTFFQSPPLRFHVAWTLDVLSVTAFGLEEADSSSPVVRIDDSAVAADCGRMLLS